MTGWIPLQIARLVMAGTSLAAFPPRPRAYLDPGTGSLLLQVLAASLLAILYLAARARDKIKAFFSDVLERWRKQ